MDQHRRKTYNPNQSICKIPEEDLQKQTLREILRLLQTKITSFGSVSDAIIDEKDRLKQGCRKVANRLRASFPLDPNWQARREYENQTALPKDATTCTLYELQNKSAVCVKCTRNEEFALQNVTAWREKVNLQLELKQIRQTLDDVHCKCVRTLDQDDDSHAGIQEGMVALKQMLEKYGESQSRTEKLVEKLYEDFDAFCQRSSSHPDSGSTRDTNTNLCSLQPLTEGFQRLCDKISKVVGLDYKPLGRELGLNEETLEKIDTNYGDSGFEDLFRLVIREWIKIVKKPTVHVLVNACYKVDPRIITEKPLSKDKIDIIESNMEFLCSEMLDVPVILPYLISKGILSLRLQKYVLSPDTKDQRIYHLMDILCNREMGFDECCNALVASKQNHIVDKLKGTDDVFFDAQQQSITKNTLNQTENSPDETEKTEIQPGQPSLLRSPSQSDVQDVLQKIALLLNTVGVKFES